MKFEWDTAKADLNYAKHKVEFKYAARIFLNSKRLTVEDARKNYTEQRFITIGEIEKRIYVVVYTIRENTCRIISARKGNSREQKKYYQFYS